MLWIQVRSLGNGELSPETIRELIPIAASDYQGWRIHLLILATSKRIVTIRCYTPERGAIRGNSLR